MNKEKISSQEIIDLIASKALISKRAAEEFIKMMIATIEEALLAGDIVKIKNFGTFKLQWNEPRKSVNVHTGEEIILDGYHKVTFIPEASLKDLVNEPFAHLEPVQLDDESNFVISEKKENEVLDPLRIFTEQASEIKDILSEIQALSVSSKPVTSEEQVKDQEQTGIEFEVSKTNEPIILDKEKVIEQAIEPTEIISEEPVLIEQEETQIISELTDDKIETSSFLENAKSKNRKIWFSVLIILLLLAGTGSGLYFLYPPAKDFTDSTYLKSKKTILKMSEGVSITDMLNTISSWVTPETKQTPIPETIFIPKDTSAMDSVTEKPQIDSLQYLFDNPRIYREYLGSERINPGSRLTIISKRYYGNKIFWVYIYEANKDHIPNPDNIPVGTLIRIPKVDSKLIDSTNPRCIQKAKELHDIYVE